MSTNNEWDEFDDDDDEVQPDDRGAPKALRAALRKEKAERKALEEELGKIRSDLRSRSVKDVLNSKGVDPRIAAFIPADAEGEEGIVKWLGEYGDLFGLGQADEDTVDVGEVSDNRRAQAAQSGSAPSPDTDLMAGISGSASPAELQAALQKLGLG
jgi:hypothetical protein